MILFWFTHEPIGRSTVYERRRHEILSIQIEVKDRILYRQVGEHNKKVKIKWKIDAHVASLERETETDLKVGEEEKLQIVLRELEARELIGELDEDKPYIRGIVPMRWGMYDDDGMRPNNQGPFVYFSAIQDDILLGLGGSSHHVEGYYGATATGSRSATPALVEFLLSGVESGEPPPSFEDLEREDRQNVYDAMALANHYLKGPIQTVEFVAKVLCRDSQCSLKPRSNERGEAILATPLYVCQVDPMSVDN